MHFDLNWRIVSGPLQSHCIHSHTTYPAKNDFTAFEATTHSLVVIPSVCVCVSVCVSVCLWVSMAVFFASAISRFSDVWTLQAGGHLTSWTGIYTKAAYYVTVWCTCTLSQKADCTPAYVMMCLASYLVHLVSPFNHICISSSTNSSLLGKWSEAYSLLIRCAFCRLLS